MFRYFKPFFLISETPIHAGSGSEIGIVDLPIQRERHTNFPKIEASGLKGCIREAFEELCIKKDKKCNLIKSPVVDSLKEKFPNIESPWKEVKNGKEIQIKDSNGNELILYNQAIKLAFGPEEGDAHAGSLAFTDAKILFFPVKSLKGIFAWITCPQVLERFKQDMKIAGNNYLKNFPLIEERSIPRDSNIIVTSKVVLEEFTFDINPSDETKKLGEWFSKIIFPIQKDDDIYKYWREKLKKDIVILSDDEFTDFVTYSTEVITRTKIDDETGTVQSGALWTEEYLPPETIMYSIAMGSPPRVKNDEGKEILKDSSPGKAAEKVIEFFESGLTEILQIGGNQTIGKGIVRIQLYNIKREDQG